MCNLVEQKGDSADSISYLTTADHDYTTYDHENKCKPPAVGAKYVSSALWEPEHLICMDKTGSMAEKAPGYHKWAGQNQLPPATYQQCLRVKPSLNLSSGSLFVLVQQRPLMKSLDTWTSAIGRSEVSLLISRKRETSMSQSANDQPFTNHFKMRTFRYDLIYVKLLGYAELCHEASFQHP